MALPQVVLWVEIEGVARVEPTAVVVAMVGLWVETAVNVKLSIAPTISGGTVTETATVAVIPTPIVKGEVVKTAVGQFAPSRVKA